MTKKEIIKKEAARLFRLKGYKATSMRDIAQEVGMEAASLYNHIANKQELLSETMMYIAEIFTAGMEDILQSSRPISILSNWNKKWCNVYWMVLM